MHLKLYTSETKTIGGRSLGEVSNLRCAKVRLSVPRSLNKDEEEEEEDDLQQAGLCFSWMGCLGYCTNSPQEPIEKGERPPNTGALASCR